MKTEIKRRKVNESEFVEPGEYNFDETSTFNALLRSELWLCVARAIYLSKSNISKLMKPSNFPHHGLHSVTLIIHQLRFH